MVDGDTNTVSEHEFVPRPWGKDNPYGNVFDTTSQVCSLARWMPPAEADGKTGPLLEDAPIPNVKNSVGKAHGLQALCSGLAR